MTMSRGDIEGAYWRALRGMAAQMVAPLADPLDVETISLALEPHFSVLEATLRIIMLTHDRAVAEVLQGVHDRALATLDADARALEWIFED